MSSCVRKKPNLLSLARCMSCQTDPLCKGMTRGDRQCRNMFFIPSPDKPIDIYVGHIQTSGRPIQLAAIYKYLFSISRSAQLCIIILIASFRTIDRAGRLFPTEYTEPRWREKILRQNCVRLIRKPRKGLKHGHGPLHGSTERQLKNLLGAYATAYSTMPVISRCLLPI